MTPGDREMVEDLVKAAHADARRKLDDAMADAMKQATGGLGGMLPGFKLPF
jgi:DNA-binding protein YbaB